MKSNGIVRIESLTLKNFKNIKNCEVCFAEAKKLSRGVLDEDDFSSVLGLYGQNGSGKTSCIEGLRILQFLLSGAPINKLFQDLINVDSTDATIGATFYVKTNSTNYYVIYECTISKKENGIEILEEKLSYHLLDEGNKKINIFSFKAPNEINGVFKEYLGVKNSDVYRMVASLETKSNTNQASITSSIFNPKLLTFVNELKGEDDSYKSIVNELYYFAKLRFAIYQINYFNEIANVGIRIRVKDETNSSDPACSDIFVNFNQTTIKVEYFNLLKKTIDTINSVLPAIIKDCRVELLDVVKTKQQLINIVDDVVNFRLVSKRNNKYIPLYYESNGIKKIISILSGFIDAFNNEGTFIAIDELDSGIFEYLLGELVYAFDNFAFGQLFFTSHNMRILEKIDPKNIYFSTIDSDDKFIQIASVRETNNLRNLYYKYIANGYKDKYKLYNNVKTENIISALSKSFSKGEND